MKALRSRVLWGAVLFAAMAVLLGCGNGGKMVAAPEMDDSLPKDLQRMQGVWQVASMNQCAMCDVNIDGLTIRLKYQSAPTEPLLKRNVSIKSVDEERKMLLMHNDLGGWSYHLLQNNGQEQLDLHFFNTSRKAWEQVYLIKSRTGSAG